MALTSKKTQAFIKYKKARNEKIKNGWKPSQEYTKEEKADYQREYRRKEKLHNKQGGHYVYYLPHTHYCGVTYDMTTRMRWHKTKGHLIGDDYKVLFHTFDRNEAIHVEAMYQSLLAMNGLSTH